jgi:hypothetical protein
MKLFSISKLSIVLVCLGGALLAAPQSRAQSEIAPDHFDGTDPWAAAAKTPAKTKAHAAPPVAAAQDRNPKPASPVLQPVAVRRPDASTTKRRKSTTPNSSN